jgi:hypothetical protein
MTRSTSKSTGSVTVLPQLEPSSLPDAASPLRVDNEYDDFDDDYNEYDFDDDYNLELDASETHFHLPAKDLASRINISPSQQQQLRQRRMTPQLARQKVSNLSYEIGVLKKIQERLERRRERFLFYCSDSS